MNALRPGERLTTADGSTMVVGALLGQGGQGQVFQVECDGRPMALKWYHPATTDSLRDRAAEQRAALRDYIVPKVVPDRRFLWPVAFVEQPGTDRFGYLMELRPSNFISSAPVVVGSVRPAPTDEVLCTVAVGLADCFRALHLSGACYKDINLGGVFLDPKTGEVSICDCDNVRVDKTKGTIWFPEFAAPEVLRGLTPSQASSDQHSLAVLLFYLFLRGHPLEGARSEQVHLFDLPAQRKFFGSSPLFVFDPDDRANQPVPGIHEGPIRLWPSLPQFLKDLFTQAFTEGLRTPNRRVTDGQWMEAFAKLRDLRVRCSCGAESYLDPQDIDSGRPEQCRRCGRPIQMGPHLRIGSQVVILNPDTRLFPHHLGRALDFSRPVARMSPHPEKPNAWGLTNLSVTPWTYQQDGANVPVPPGRSVPLRDGRIINIGAVRAVVRFG